MEVLYFQIILFLIILFSSLGGRGIRNIVAGLAIAFTLLMVFMNWLILLQLFTIVCAIGVSETIYDFFDRSEPNRPSMRLGGGSSYNPEDRTYKESNKKWVPYVVIIAVGSGLLYLFISNQENESSTKKPSITLEESKQTIAPTNSSSYDLERNPEYSNVYNEAEIENSEDDWDEIDYKDTGEISYGKVLFDGEPFYYDEYNYSFEPETMEEFYFIELIKFKNGRVTRIIEVSNNYYKIDYFNDYGNITSIFLRFTENGRIEIVDY